MSDPKTPLSMRWTVAQRAAAAGLANPLVQRRARSELSVADGRRLHPAFDIIVTLARRRPRPTESVQARRADLARLSLLSMPMPTGVYSVERTIPGPAGDISVRVYRPFGTLEPRPGIVFFHGGGFVTGNLDSHEGVCRMIALKADAVVVSVDYRLAPEHRFPAAVEDSIAAYAWVREHAEELGMVPKAVGVMGDSAGGNLSAVVSIAARDRGLPLPTGQCLVYPVTDFEFTFDSHRSVGTGYGLDHPTMLWFRDHYVPDPAMYRDPLLAPNWVEDLSGLPPALVVTAGFDPLRDEGQEYARRLSAAGVTTQHVCYDNMIHAFFNIGIVPDCLGAAEEISATFGEVLRANA